MSKEITTQTTTTLISMTFRRGLYISIPSMDGLSVCKWIILEKHLNDMMLVL